MGRKSISKERKVLNTKQKKWLAKTMPFFYKNGIYKPTMNDIANYLELSKATIYNYYESKEELVHDALWLKLKEMDQFIDILADESLGFLERFYKGIGHSTNCLEGLSPLYLTDLKNHYPKSWESVQLYKQRTSENLKDYYDEGIKRGIFRPFNTQLMSSLDLEHLNLLVDSDFLVSNSVSFQEAYNEYFCMKFNGLLTDRDLGLLTNVQNN